MAKPLSILYVTSEIIPYAKISGLADVAFSFALAIRDIGHDMRVMLPKYGTTSERKNKIHEINRLKSIPIQVGQEIDYATVKSSSINNPRTKVQAYITTNVRFFDEKKGIYLDPKTGKAFSDNDQRFIFFTRTVIETCLLLGWFPDIIHCCDWQTALIPAYARTIFPTKFKKTKFVMTFHDFSDQGVFPEDSFTKTGLSADVKPNLMHNNKVNYLKAGLIYSDYITTSSETIADIVLKDDTFGDGLNQILKKRKDKFMGLNTGLDPWTLNPRIDNEISTKFETDFNFYKSSNKKALLELINSSGVQSKPLVSIVAPIKNDKAFTNFLESIDKIAKEDCVLLINADGDKEMKTKIKKIVKKYPEKVFFVDNNPELTLRKIIAGTDILLHPVEHEPTGVDIISALQYGTVPVAPASGAMLDFLIQYDEKNKTGNGFVYDFSIADDLLKQLKLALNLYNKAIDWNRLSSGLLSGDYTWEKTARKYDEIYRSLMKE